MAPAAARQLVNIANVQLALQCPVTFEPYGQDDAQAVVLVARDKFGNRICGHSVSEYTAKRLIAASTRSCPQCRAIFSDYVPNLAINALAADILQPTGNGDVVPALSKKIRLEEPDIGSIPFPGKGAHFEMEGPGWDDVGAEPVHLCREMRFISHTQDSAFSEFSVLGYGNGDVCLSVRWQTDTVRDYLKRCNIAGYIDQSFCFVSSTSTRKKLLRILALHNEIPEPHFALARRLIEAGDWRQVTPLPK